MSEDIEQEDFSTEDDTFNKVPDDHQPQSHSTYILPVGGNTDIK